METASGGTCTFSRSFRRRTSSTGEEVAALLRRVYATPKAVVERAAIAGKGRWPDADPLHSFTQMLTPRAQRSRGHSSKETLTT